VTCSIFTLTALSVDHYFTVKAPTRRSQQLDSGQRGAIIILVAIWIISAVLVGPILHVRHVHIVDLSIDQVSTIRSQAPPVNEPLSICIIKAVVVLDIGDDWRRLLLMSSARQSVDAPPRVEARRTLEIETPKASRMDGFFSIGSVFATKIACYQVNRLGRLSLDAFINSTGKYRIAY